MGLLINEFEEPMNFNETVKYQRMLKANAAKQLARLFLKFEKFEKCPKEKLKFGTELECHLLQKKMVGKNELFTVFLDSKPLMKLINQKYPEVEVKEEYSAWMVEFTPKSPFECFLSFAEIRRHFKTLDRISRDLRNELVLLLGMSVMPLIGSLNYHVEENGVAIPLKERSGLNTMSKSDRFLDTTIAQHSRYVGLTKNNYLRTGHKPCIILPISQDTNTQNKTVVLDHLGFGTSNTALQITYSCENLKQARFAHDMMHLLSPFLLVFSSSTFACSQNMVDYDNRLKILENALDDRRSKELQGLAKSRYSTINYFVSDDFRCKAKYNDNKTTINKRFYKLLRKELKLGKSKLANDKRLLNHFSYLFVRDYLIVFEDRIKKDNVADSIDFEALQSTNYQNMRLKPPPSFDSTIGWLLEFRCMDSPITEVEKSMLTFICTLFFRIVTDDKMQVNFYIPISKVDHNYQQASFRDSNTKGKFFFRKHFCKRIEGYIESEIIVEITLQEFWFGSSQFAGMRKLVEVFLQINESKIEEEGKRNGENLKDAVWKVFDFLGQRASGQLNTLPNFFRGFVNEHKDYHYDSVLNDLVIRDIIQKAVEIQDNNYEQSMFADFKI